MKKLLLLSVLAMAVAAQSVAQEKNTHIKADVKAMKMEGMRAAVAPVNALKRVENVNAGITPVKRAPRKVMADSVWYQRPEGTMYVSGNSTSGGWIYPLIPPFVTTVWPNMAKDKASAKWSFVGSSASYPLTDFDGKDLEMDFPKIGNGYISTLYVPHLSVGDVDYSVGSEFKSTDPNTPSPQVALINGDSLQWSVSQVNRYGGFYTGFSDGYAFGSDLRTFRDDEGNTFEAKADAIYEYFQKPITPLYLSSFFLYAVTMSDEMIPEGTNMTLSIYKVEDDHQLGDLIEEMTFNMNDTIYYDVNESWDGQNEVYKAYSLFEVKKVESDAYGTEYQVPVIIDDEFAVVISGFDQAGVDFSLYMCDVRSTEADYYENTQRIMPTLRSFVRADNGEPLEGLRYCQYIDSKANDEYNKEDQEADPEHYQYYDYRRQYNAGILLNCMYDVVLPIPGFENMIAPVEGGAIYFEEEVTEEDDDGNEVTETVRYETTQLFTTLPYISTWEGLEGEANYEVVDLPDWLEVEEWSQEYYYAENPEEENDPNVLVVAIKAQPLPEGLTGRTATFRVVSERGADSGLITVVQGEGDSQSIVTVSNGAAVKPQGKLYNLNGQRIAGNYKGITIQNGKKIIVK